MFLGAGEKRPDNWTLRALLGEASGIVWKQDKRGGGRGGVTVYNGLRIKVGSSWEGAPHIMENPHT